MSSELYNFWPVVDVIVPDDNVAEEALEDGQLAEGDEEYGEGAGE